MPAKNKLSDLRNHLFETLESLRDEDSPMDISRAQAVASIANSIIASAKVELRAAELLGLDPHLVDGTAIAAGYGPAMRLAAGPPTPVDDRYCQPCLERKQIHVNTERVVDGTPMCKACLGS